MAKEVELSIIIVNFNTYSFLKSCLDSILKGDLEGSKYEIIVADNSSDNKKFKLLQQQYPKIRLIANRKNAGFARANNQAIKAVKG